MKEFYLVYRGGSMPGYFYGEGIHRTNLRNQQNLGNLDESGLKRRLGELINPKRNSLLHAVGVLEEVKPIIRALFQGTKVEIDFEKR
jgi:hypothetical protein